MPTIKRRDFIKGTAASAAASVLPWTMTGNVLGANDTLGAATVGFRSRGHSHIRLVNNKNGCKLVALCDADKGVVGSGIKKYGESVKGYTDIRKMLEQKDIDIVTTATPNHWHALVTIWSIQAGKDVYVEKPVCHNVWEGRQMVEWARKEGKIVQTGTQSRSSRSSIGKAVKFVQDGNLGKIQYAVGTCFKPRKSIGKLSQPMQIPENVDYDLWCGPAAKVDLYRPRLHYDWHWDYNTGNGDMGNQGIHQMDIARWFLGEPRLSPRVLSVGGRLGYDDGGDTANTQTVYHDYEKAPLIFETRGLPNRDLNWGTGMPRWRGSGVGVIVQCEGGHVLVPNYYSAVAYDKSGKEVKKWRGTDPMTPHVQNFLSAVRSRKHSDLNADIEEGFVSSALCITGNISHKLGKPASPSSIQSALKSDKLFAESAERLAQHLEANKIDLNKTKVTFGAVLEMDPKTERFTNNDAANKLLSRAYRKDFAVPAANGKKVASG